MKKGNDKPKITVNPKIAFGKPVITGTRISVEFILELLSSGWTVPAVLEEYPHLEKEDILACIEYARELVIHQKAYPLSILRSPDMMRKLHENLSR